MNAYQELTNEIAEALSNYIELCDNSDMELSIKGFGEHLVDSYDL